MTPSREVPGCLNGGQFRFVKKTLLFSSLAVAVLVVLRRYSYFPETSSNWHSRYGFSCKANSEGSDYFSSSPDNVNVIHLKRMVYPKPETLKPPRTNVLSVSPWLAPIVWEGNFNIDILNELFRQENVRIGLTVFAIKKYIRFLKTFIETAEKFFMVGYPVNYYIFTDLVSNVTNFNMTVGPRKQLIFLEVPSYERWQDVTMRRMQMIRDFTKQRFASEVDYLVCVDVDMRFQDHVGVEILSDVFGTLHPAFFVKGRDKFTFERRPESQAYIPEDEGDFYYAGGYFGGKVEEVYKLTNHCHHAMLTDKANNIEAIWHDESYLNNYFLYYKKPTKILSPEYLWNERDGTAFYLRKRRLISLHKNADEVRN
ncbi:histo-blood group ABO system transferase isoform X2 [Xenopus tropicalis]|uniref:Histo-blood group ABO system transferase isoform X2 n=1 Tax=Xenopus tropicalis TaxID=8364 RepID=A0A8J1IP98_XENTR|nr:histo-blood group ABO system transferase isoform X2 [Xenopus tropicalis]